MLNIVKGYSHCFNNIHYFEPELQTFITDKKYAFSYNSWAFMEHPMYNHYVSICVRSVGVWDTALEWLYDTIQHDYVLSDRPYNATTFTEQTIRYRVPTFAIFMHQLDMSLESYLKQ